MAKKPPKSLTTSEFSKLTGIPASTVAKLLRDGRIEGEKVSGRWMIAADQAKRQAVQEIGQKGPPAKAVKPKAAAKAPESEAKSSGKGLQPEASQSARTQTRPKADAKTFSISEFSRLTFLTDYGVEAYLKQGRLRGSKDARGEWRIAADNLEDPRLKHLVR